MLRPPSPKGECRVSGSIIIIEPAEVIAETNAYLEENNPVAIWLPKMYQITRWTGDREKIEDVYNNYNSYFPKNPYYNKKKFGDLMSLINFKSKVYNSIRYYDGIKLIANTTYKGGIGNELEFTPNEEQLKFINLFLPFLINKNNTKINEIMQIYSLNIDMVFWDRAGQDILLARLSHI